MTLPRLLFADQLGPHFDDGGPIILVESRRAFDRRATHRAKAHLYLSALRHRRDELGDRVEYIEAEDFADALEGREFECIDPTSFRARALVRRLGAEVLPSRGFVTSEADFREWVDGKEDKSLLMDRFYRHVRESTGLLMRGKQPEGGSFSFDKENRHAPPRNATGLGLPDPWRPTEDAIDEDVRATLDRWVEEGLHLVGDDSPRWFAVTRDEALTALDDFLETRLGDFGTYEDAVMENDWAMAHSLLSLPMNLGLLDPRECVDRAVVMYEKGEAPLNSVEGYVRQLIGWRDWMWHLYWHLGEDYVHRNELKAHEPLPAAFTDLDTSHVEANCLTHVLDGVRERGWAHHIPRLMILGNHALQRAYDPAALTSWFQGVFVDGTPWVMPTNVVGMSQHADGGIVATKPYASGGAYIDRMTDFCGSCRFDPKKRLGEDACPFTAGYWAFLDRVEPKIADNPRMRQPLSGLRRLSDREDVVDQERRRESW